MVGKRKVELASLFFCLGPGCVMITDKKETREECKGRKGQRKEKIRKRKGQTKREGVDTENTNLTRNKNKGKGKE